MSSRSKIVLGVTSLIAIGALAVAATHASAIFALILALLAAIVGTVVTRGAAQNLMLGLTSLLLVACVIEGVAMAVEPHVVVKRDDGLIVPRLTVGWGPGHAGNFHAERITNGHVIYDVTYGIDERLLRKTVSGSQGEAVTFLGDSYIFGEGLPDSDTLPQQFADLEGRRHPVFNLGFSAYNAAQILAELRTGLFDDLIRRSRVIVEFLAPWQAERTSCKAPFVTGAPHYESIDGKITFRGYCDPHPSRWTYFAAYRVFVAPRIKVATNSDVTILTQVAQQTVRVLSQKYGKPVVVYYLRNPGYLRGTGWTDEKIMAAMTEAGADVLDYTLVPNYSPQHEIAGDGHPNKLANALRAKRLAAYLAKTFPETRTAAGATQPDEKP